MRVIGVAIGDSDDYMDEDEFARWIAQRHQEEMGRFSTTVESRAETRRTSPVNIPGNPPITAPPSHRWNYKIETL